jgi:hypothetical protein
MAALTLSTDAASKSSYNLDVLTCDFFLLMIPVDVSSYTIILGAALTANTGPTMPEFASLWI